MDATKRRNDCPDCGGSLQPITLLDQAESSSGEMRYSAEPPRKLFLGLVTRYNPELIGQLQGLMCSACGRVLLYAAPVGDADR